MSSPMSEINKDKRRFTSNFASCSAKGVNGKKSPLLNLSFDLPPGDDKIEKVARIRYNGLCQIEPGRTVLGAMRRRIEGHKTSVIFGTPCKQVFMKVGDMQRSIIHCKCWEKGVTLLNRSSYCSCIRFYPISFNECYKFDKYSAEFLEYCINRLIGCFQMSTCYTNVRVPNWVTSDNFDDVLSYIAFEVDKAINTNFFEPLKFYDFKSRINLSWYGSDNTRLKKYGISMDQVKKLNKCETFIDYLRALKKLNVIDFDPAVLPANHRTAFLQNTIENKLLPHWRSLKKQLKSPSIDESHSSVEDSPEIIIDEDSSKDLEHSPEQIPDTLDPLAVVKGSNVAGQSLGFLGTQSDLQHLDDNMSKENSDIEESNDYQDNDGQSLGFLGTQSDLQHLDNQNDENRGEDDGGEQIIAIWLAPSEMSSSPLSFSYDTEVERAGGMKEVEIHEDIEKVHDHQDFDDQILRALGSQSDHQNLDDHKFSISENLIHQDMEIERQQAINHGEMDISQLNKFLNNKEKEIIEIWKIYESEIQAIIEVIEYRINCFSKVSGESIVWKKSKFSELVNDMKTHYLKITVSNTLEIQKIEQDISVYIEQDICEQLSSYSDYQELLKVEQLFAKRKAEHEKYYKERIEDILKNMKESTEKIWKFMERSHEVSLKQSVFHASLLVISNLAEIVEEKPNVERQEYDALICNPLSFKGYHYLIEEEHVSSLSDMFSHSLSEDYEIISQKYTGEMVYEFSPTTKFVLGKVQWKPMPEVVNHKFNPSQLLKNDIPSCSVNSSEYGTLKSGELELNSTVCKPATDSKAPSISKDSSNNEHMAASKPKTKTQKRNERKKKRDERFDGKSVKVSGICQDGVPDNTTATPPSMSSTPNYQDSDIKDLTNQFQIGITVEPVISFGQTNITHTSGEYGTNIQQNICFFPPKRIKSTDGKDLCLFFTNKFVFSNHFPAEFTVNGITYACSEQFYMRFKCLYFNDPLTAACVMITKDPKEMKEHGKKINGFNADKWDKIKLKVMKLASFYKFTQNTNLLFELFTTMESTLVETSPDLYWGIGLSINDPKVANKYHWLGNNTLGYILTDLRNFLKFQPIYIDLVKQAYEFLNMKQPDYCNTKQLPQSYLATELNMIDNWLDDNILCTNDGFGQKILKVLGYIEGRGLGQYTNGIVKPVSTPYRHPRDRSGFGLHGKDTSKIQYEQFQQQRSQSRTFTTTPSENLELRGYPVHRETKRGSGGIRGGSGRRTFYNSRIHNDYGTEKSSGGGNSEADEQKTREYEEQIYRMKQDMENLQRDFQIAQETIRYLEQQVNEILKVKLQLSKSDLHQVIHTEQYVNLEHKLKNFTTQLDHARIESGNTKFLINQFEKM
uniref:G-patch domain-containing protein n=1 Tax=Panagrolaimus davidi TaxID=227884 RepID=A0A914QMQ1_9BILA